MDKLLVIDDDTMNLLFAEKMLANDFEIATANSGEEGLKKLDSFMPDAILLDLHMPGMSGLEVMEVLKGNEEFSKIPVIFLTADSDQNTEVTIFRSGASDYITKPMIKEVVVQRVGRIVENAKLTRNLEGEVEKKAAEIIESNKRFRKLSLEIMYAFAATIEAKDKYTNGHSTRVAEYSREIARRLGKTGDELEEVYYEGLLHDTGKIGIPDSIINKNGKLTDEEYDVIKSHPTIGAGILENITVLPRLAISAHWHHEKYDGTGYPDGLKGEDIPEIARIIAVADTYDAMTSNRSYRGVMPQEKVRAEFERCAGTQFDPVMAKIMIDMIDEDKDYDLRQK